MQSKIIIRPAVVAGILLLIPLLGNHFVEGWNWSPGAFVFLGALLFAIGLTYELVTRNREDLAYKAAVGLAFAAGFGLTWGTFVHMADVNRWAALYFVVPVVGIIGAAVARLRPSGMARALFVTAVVQGLLVVVELVLLITRKPQVGLWTAPELRGVVGNVVFVMLFAGAGMLFRRASAKGL